MWTAADKRRVQGVISRLPDPRVIEYPNVGTDSGRLPIKVTSYDAGTGYYSWTEQSYDGSGAYVDAPNAIVGTTTLYPAVERNGLVLTSFPFYSQAWLRTQADTVEAVYEFDAGSSGVTADAEMWIVQSECPIFDSTGNQIGTKVQRQKVKFPSAWLEGDAECTTNRTDCCGDGGTVTVTCCTNPLPKTLYLTLTAVSGCSCLDGVSIPLVWDGSSFWVGSGWPTSCNTIESVSLSCVLSNWQLTIKCNGLSPTSHNPDATACDPLLLTFSTHLSFCCNDSGTVTGLVTE